jgi:hypothetical protein
MYRLVCHVSTIPAMTTKTVKPNRNSQIIISPSGSYRRPDLQGNKWPYVPAAHSIVAEVATHKAVESACRHQIAVPFDLASDCSWRIQ